MFEQISPTEIPKDVDFLDPNLKITISISAEAFENYPEISKEEIATLAEKYRLLLGRWQIYADGSAEVEVSAVLELPDSPNAYTEENGAIVGINFETIREYLSDLKNDFPEYATLKLIGEMHTHPILQKDLDSNQRSWHPSDDDIDAISASYDKGSLNPAEPFVFVVAGAMENGQTGYTSYRIVKEENRFGARLVEEK